MVKYVYQRNVVVVYVYFRKALFTLCLCVAVLFFEPYNGVSPSIHVAKHMLQLVCHVALPIHQVVCTWPYPSISWCARGWTLSSLHQFAHTWLRNAITTCDNNTALAQSHFSPSNSYLDSTSPMKELKVILQ